MGRWATLLTLTLLAQGCSPSDNPSDLYPSTEKELSILSVTLPALGPTDFVEQTMHHWFTKNPPDLCALLRLESKSDLDRIANSDELAHYYQSWSLPGNDGRLSLLLSKSKPLQIIHHDLSYTVKGKKQRFQHPPMELQLVLGDGSSLRCILAPLLPKTFHPAGQSEMRRNEARLLGRLLKQPATLTPSDHTLVLTSFMDHPHSDAMKKLTTQKGWDLVDANPADVARANWTYYDAEKESCHRYDYLFTDRALAQRRIIGKCKIPTWLSPGKLKTGHRPLYSVYALKER